MMNTIFSKRANTHRQPPMTLALETLEPRMMLSTVQIFAAGATGEEQIQLEIDGQIVKTFSNVQGNYETGQFQTLTYTSVDPIQVGQVRLLFSNDGLTSNNQDRNLRVDRIRVDGVNFQTESENVFSEGHWVDGVGCSQGQLEVETLHCGGYFQFNGGSTLQLQLAGATGEEQVQLEIAGEIVRTWNNVNGDYVNGTFVNRVYTHSGLVDLADVRVLFANDGNTTSGGDKNLRFDSIKIDGVKVEAETAFSDGHWVDGVGCSQGFLGNETLECGGYFDFGQQSESTTIVVRAAGQTGEEQMRLIINGEIAKTWNNIGGDFSTRSFVTRTYVANGTVAIEDVRIEFSNNGISSNGGDRNLSVDRVELDGVIFETDAIDVFSEGAWVDGAGCVSGFFQTETLNCSGYFQFAAPNNAGKLKLQTNLINVNEDTSTVTVKVVREQGSTGTVAVDFLAQSGTAIVGEDFIANSGRLFFADGELEKSIQLTIINDTIGELSETILVTIDNPFGGVTLRAPRTTQIVIADDDSPSSDSLLAYWKFDETETGVVEDFTANGTSGTHNNFTTGYGPAENTPLLNIPNKKSLLFDGANDFVRFNATNPALNGSQFTQTFWVKPDFAGNETRGVFGGTNAAYPRVSIVGGTKLSFQIGSANSTTLLTGNVLDPDGWNFVATSYNGSQLRVYVDGELKASKAATDFGTFATGNLDIGRVSGKYFRGQIDEFKTYNESLSQAEIKNEYSAQTNVTAETIATMAGAVAIDFVPGTGQMLIGDFGGLVYVHEDDQILAQPFIDISAQVNGKRGMLDIAVHPDFANNPYIYLAFAYDPPEVYNFTGLAGPDGGGNRASRLIRVTADASNGYRTAVAGSEVILLGTNSTWENFNGFVNSTIDFDEPPGGILPDGTNVQDFLAADSESHTIGSLEFGPDGALYVGNGDGASYNQVDPRAARTLDIDNLSGKVLRIDPLSGEGLTDNPFYDGDPDSNRSKVFQLGLRNPFRMAANNETGQLYVGDVGWGAWEEINAGGAGANYGWPYFEGGDDNGPIQSLYSDLPEAIDYYNTVAGRSTVAGILNLSHSEDSIDAVIVGDVYDGGVYGSEYEGDLFFNYLGSGLVRHISFDSAGNITNIESFTDKAGFIVQMTVAPDGHIYFVDQITNEIKRWIL